MTFIKTWAFPTLAVAALAGTSAAAAAEMKGTNNIGVLAIPKGPERIGRLLGHVGCGNPPSASTPSAGSRSPSRTTAHASRPSPEARRANLWASRAARQQRDRAPRQTPDIGIVLGSACWSAAPHLPSCGRPASATSAPRTQPALTAPDRKPSCDGFMRTCYSDIDQGAADAKYLYGVLKARKVVTIHDGGLCATARPGDGGQLQEIGGTVLSAGQSRRQNMNMHPVLTRMRDREAGCDLRADLRHRGAQAPCVSPRRSQPSRRCRSSAARDRWPPT